MSLLPNHIPKADAEAFLQGCIDRLAVQIESQEADVERLSSGKGAKKNRAELEEKESTIRKNRWHIGKMEQVIRMINNDQVCTKPRFSRFSIWISVDLRAV